MKHRSRFRAAVLEGIIQDMARDTPTTPTQAAVVLGEQGVQVVKCPCGHLLEIPIYMREADGWARCGGCQALISYKTLEVIACGRAQL